MTASIFVKSRIAGTAQCHLVNFKIIKLRDKSWDASDTTQTSWLPSGILEAVFITNASYINENITSAPWYKEIDVIKYISYYIYIASILVILLQS